MSAHRTLIENALRLAMKIDPNQVLIVSTNTGTVVRARDIATLAALLITDTCPACGSTPWVNIDCDVCQACAYLTRDPDDRDERVLQ